MVAQEAVIIRASKYNLKLSKKIQRRIHSYLLGA